MYLLSEMMFINFIHIIATYQAFVVRMYVNNEYALIIANIPEFDLQMTYDKDY